MTQPSRASQAVRVLAWLAAGLLLGLAFPGNSIVGAIAESGTWFPRTIVTLATAIVFILIAATLAKTLLSHARATRLLSIIVCLYVGLGALSLAYVSAWIPVLTKLPFSRADVPLPGIAAWLHAILAALATTFAEQPLLQVLVAGTIAGALTGSIRALRPTATGLISIGDWILSVFGMLRWYYPIMIGCLAVSIPSRFGLHGLSIYARTSVDLAIVAIAWSAVMIVLTRTLTKRTWTELWSYFATVYVTGFGTGGSYDTLPVNLLSAERDLGLRPRVARTSIVLGTVLNKNVATMAVLLVTVSTCALLGIQISMAEIAVLIPPVMILGLESPGIPGGAGMFMSPVIASVLAVHDPATFVTTFVTLYSGVIPMLATAGNTTDDGFVGAIVNDCFVEEAEEIDRPIVSTPPRSGPVGAAGLVIAAGGVWMIVSPQAKVGLAALRWMSRPSFAGEALVGAAVLLVGVTLLTRSVNVADLQQS